MDRSRGKGHSSEIGVSTAQTRDFRHANTFWESMSEYSSVCDILATIKKKKKSVTILPVG